MNVTESIPFEKFETFNEILKATGGRYTANPLVLFNSIQVSYEPTPETLEAWNRATTPIKETATPHWLRKWRRLMSIFNRT